MAKIKKSDINKYTDSRACCYVLSCLLKDPKLALSKTQPIDDFFFINKTHRALFIVIENLAQLGVKTVKLADIENYLANHDQLTHARFFGQVSDETDWILSLLEEETDERNYQYYYDIVYKFAFLRAKMESGQDVSDILDMTEIDGTILDRQYEEFTTMSINDIIRYFDNLALETKHKFMKRDSRNSSHAGEDIDEVLLELEKSPDYGFRSSTGRYSDNLTRGLRRGNLIVDSRNSGTGKTRDALYQCVITSCHEMWCEETQRFEPNPYGAVYPTLYFNTEQDLKKEIKPILISFVSGVETKKIKSQNLTKEERERVIYAKEILKESPIWLEREPNYDCTFLENIIDKHVREHGVDIVLIDYIELTAPMISEYVKMTKGLQAREDSILLNVSTVLKNLAEEKDIAIKMYTQISDNARRDETIRDSGAIKGSKSLQVRADVGIVTMRPTVKELAKLEPIITVLGCKKPNICFNFYKNRDGDLTEFKVWGLLNLGTYHLEELFVTDWNYLPFEYDIEKLYLSVEEEVNEFGEIETKNCHIVEESELPLYKAVEDELRKRDKKKLKGINKKS